MVKTQNAKNRMSKIYKKNFCEIKRNDVDKYVLISNLPLSFMDSNNIFLEFYKYRWNHLHNELGEFSSM